MKITLDEDVGIKIRKLCGDYRWTTDEIRQKVCARIEVVEKEMFFAAGSLDSKIYNADFANTIRKKFIEEQKSAALKANLIFYKAKDADSTAKLFKKENNELYSFLSEKKSELEKRFNIYWSSEPINFSFCAIDNSTFLECNHAVNGTRKVYAHQHRISAKEVLIDYFKKLQTLECIKKFDWKYFKG